jgi:hypothetical protein
MRTSISGVVTWDDLKTYFKGAQWARRDFSDNRFQGATRHFSVDIEPEAVQFEYKIEAVDDPSDSESGVSDDPVAKIAKFLGRDLPGGEFFEQRASGPRAVASALRTAAGMASRGAPSRRAVSAALRRAASIPFVPGALRTLRAAASRLAGMAEERFDELESKMESKGWEVKRRESDGREELVVDVSGIYEATISLDSIRYHYMFQFADRPDLTKSGTTEDPIQEFRNYYKDPDVQEAASAARPMKKDESPMSFQRTVPAKGDPGSEDRRTVPSGPGRDDRPTVAPGRA